MKKDEPYMNEENDQAYENEIDDIEKSDINESDIAETYALAVLAALLDPALCKTKPGEAIDAAEKLLSAVMKHQLSDLRTLEMFFMRRKEKAESLAKKLAEPVSYSEAVRFIADEYFTAHPKLYRAKERFIKFWAAENGITETEAKRQLRDYEDGKKNFTLGEAMNLKEKYDARKSQPKKKKGKQGRRKSKYDGRVGIAPGGRIAETIPELRHGWRLVPKTPRT